MPEEPNAIAVVEGQIGALVEPYGMTFQTYTEDVIKNYGYLGLARGTTVLPKNTMDASEYLRILDENKHELQSAEKKEAELLSYMQNPASIPSHLSGRYALKGRFHIPLLSADLSQIRQGMQREYNYVFSLIKNTRIIDGEAFRAEMSPLLIKYIEELTKQKEQAARRIISQRGT